LWISATSPNDAPCKHQSRCSTGFATGPLKFNSSAFRRAMRGLAAGKRQQGDMKRARLPVLGCNNPVGVLNNRSKRGI
jgi:hypothetical protein